MWYFCHILNWPVRDSMAIQRLMGVGGRRMDWKSLFFSGDGRIGRQTFWIGFAVLMGAWVIINMVPGFGQLIAIAMTWCWICLYAKRLHDMGKSGWLVLVPVLTWVVALVIAFIAGGAGIIAAAMHTGDRAMAAFWGGMGGAVLAFGLAGLVNLGFLLWVGLTAPTPGENAYGPHPAAVSLP